jgi:hypothetical protein
MAGRVWRRPLAPIVLVVREGERVASGSRTTRARPDQRGRMPSGPQGRADGAGTVSYEVVGPNPLHHPVGSRRAELRARRMLGSVRGG